MGCPLACVTSRTITTLYPFLYASFYLLHVSSQTLNKYILAFIFPKRRSPAWVFLFESREKKDKYSSFKGISVSFFSVIRTSMRERKTLPLFKEVLSIFSVLKQIYNQTSNGFFSTFAKTNCFSKALLILLKRKYK